LNGSIDFVAKLGKRRGQRPILVKFTSFLVKLEVLRYTGSLAGLQIRRDNFSLETRKTWSSLIPYPKDAKKN
jgi:hypothetical protein